MNQTVNQSQKANIEALLLLSIRIIVGAILIYASHDKILDPGSFAGTIYNYRILPDNLITLAAVFLPWFEFVLGAFLIFGIWMEGTVFMVNLLFLIFTAAVAFNVFRGVDIDCGCFGSSSETSHTMQEALIRDIFILFGTTYLFIRLIIQKRLKKHPLKFN